MPPPLGMAACTLAHARILGNTQSIIAGNARHIIPCTEIVVCIIVYILASKCETQN